MAGDQERVLRFLSSPAAHGSPGPVKRIDTANAIVFLAGDTVCKVKRAVRYPYMDLSTLEKRRAACEAELEVNRANAPALYIGVAPIVEDASGLSIGGEGEVVEWAVRMRRFDENLTLDRLAERGELTEALIDRLAEAVRASHARSPRRNANAATAALETYIGQNAGAFAERPDLFPEAAARRLTQDMRAAFAIARSSLIRRGAKGFVRRCHGDLHLRNVAIVEGEPVLFDAIEFSDAIASGDVLYDLAFLLMDLETRSLRGASNRLLNRYLAPEPPESLAGLSALPLLMGLRAAIRAKVDAAGAERMSEAGRREEALGHARRYFDLARDLMRYSAPRLVAVGGLSGTGKSALSGRLAPWLGRAPGALWLRSDVERKLMLGLDEQAPAPASAYVPDMTGAVYRRLDEKARRALQAGQSVVLDATFSSGAERQAASDIAASLGVAFDGIFLEASAEIRIARVSARRGDASDANADVARAQRAEPLAERGWRPLAAEAGLDATVALARSRLAL
jgi:aminoglycoside phosphotransferase family enzyme/predicted kinase